MCSRVESTMSGAGHLNRVLGARSNELTRRLRGIPGPPLPVDAFQQIMERIHHIARLPGGDEALQGLDVFTGLLNGPNRQRNTWAVFERVVNDTDLVDYLRLWRNADASIPPQPRAALATLANSVNGEINVRGTYFQLKFCESRGFGNIHALETSGTPGSVRGLDVTTAIGDSPRFFEVKGGLSWSADQVKRQLNTLGAADVNAWQHYRLVVNADPASVQGLQDLQGIAAKMLDDLSTETSPVFQNLFNHLSRNGFDVRGQAGSFDHWFRNGGAPAGAMDVIEEAQRLLVMGHNAPIPPLTGWVRPP